MDKQIIPIRGMHCRSCEILIEEKLQELPSIRKIKVEYKKSQAVIESDHPLDLAKVKNLIEEAGYHIGTEEKSWISKDESTYRDLIISAIVLVAIIFIGQRTNLLNFGTSSSSGDPKGLGIVFLVGLTAGVSSCMALIGGLVLGISAKHAEMHPETTLMQKFRPHLFFNLGRIAAYFIFGGLIGLVGKAFQLSGLTLGAMTVVVGLVMLVLGLQLTEISPRLSLIKFTLPSSLAKFFSIKKHHEKEYSHINSMLVGGLTFFLPCGFTQSMQLLAMSTGNFWSGALIMGVFALGTMPGLLGIGGLTSLVKGTMSQKFFKFVGLLIIILAVFNINNGLRLTGFEQSSNKPQKNKIIKNSSNVSIVDGVQIVKLTQNTNGYSPTVLRIKSGIPTKLIINSTNPFSCAGSIYIPKLNIGTRLNQGENVFEFNSIEQGKINYSCLMGMYSGQIIVE